MQEIRNILTTVDFKAKIQTLNTAEYEVAVTTLVIHTLEGSAGDQTMERPVVAQRVKVDIGKVDGTELAMSPFRNATTVRV